ncbi:unnamed protein product [Paramecium octaurelia]|uniref:Uncharacterized protein n=1 Tax=Paramecium octaurelia TaxID=43137 RepID=A0A8S1S468_PAROT|nr:unnamed protein product [Paramecium octaurelia]
MKSQYENYLQILSLLLNQNQILSQKPSYIQNIDKRKCVSHQKKSVIKYNCTQLSPKQTIFIPSIITVPLQNQLQYQKPQKAYREPLVFTARSKKSVPNIYSLNLRKTKIIFNRNQKQELKLFKNNVSFFSHWSYR